MRFTWKGLLLAPSLIPALFSGALVGLGMLGSPPNPYSLLAFVILFVAGCFVSYSAMIFLFLPALFVVSRCRRMSWVGVWLLGAVLGLLMFVPVTAMEWKGSGPDSGPPVDPFIAFLIRFGVDPLTLVYPFAGLVTAAVYWRLGAPRGAAATASKA
jgi:energy-coupling factor transporter transmembrane protein EcfT